MRTLWNRPLADSRQPSHSFEQRKGFGLLEFLIVLAIVVLLIFFVTQCMGSSGKGASSGGAAAGLQASAEISAARETIKTAAKNLSIAMAPVDDCTKAASLTADVNAAQAKIDAAAKDYHQEYAAEKASIQQDVDNLNQAIQLYNHNCNATVPTITLPP